MVMAFLVLAISSMQTSIHTFASITSIIELGTNIPNMFNQFEDGIALLVGQAVESTVASRQVRLLAESLQ